MMYLQFTMVALVPFVERTSKLCLNENTHIKINVFLFAYQIKSEAIQRLFDYGMNINILLKDIKRPLLLKRVMTVIRRTPTFYLLVGQMYSKIVKKHNLQ